MTRRNSWWWKQKVTKITVSIATKTWRARCLHCHRWPRSTRTNHSHLSTPHRQTRSLNIPPIPAIATVLSTMSTSTTTQCQNSRRFRQFSQTYCRTHSALIWVNYAQRRVMQPPQRRQPQTVNPHCKMEWLPRPSHKFQLFHRRSPHSRKHSNEKDRAQPLSVVNSWFNMISETLSSENTTQIAFFLRPFFSSLYFLHFSAQNSWVCTFRHGFVLSDQCVFLFLDFRFVRWRPPHFIVILRLLLNLDEIILKSWCNHSNKIALHSCIQINRNWSKDSKWKKKQFMSRIFCLLYLILC